MMYEKGFTLIEILIVVAILGVLASVAIPQFTKFRVEALDAEAVSDLNQLAKYQQSFKTENYIFAPIVIADKVGNRISVTANGQSFDVSPLSEEVEVINKVSSDGQFAILAVKHPSSQTIIAMDLDSPNGVKKLEDQSALTDAVLPTPTSGNDLSGWATF